MTDKFCINCKYHVANNIGSDNQYDICISPKNGYNLINGKRKDSYCQVNRMEWLNENQCSNAGNWFEQKEKQVELPKSKTFFDKIKDLLNRNV